MAVPETQNPNADHAPALIAEAAPSEQAATVSIFAHDWITYLMVLGAVCIIVGVPLVLLGDAWSRSTMVLIGAVCYTVSAVAWMVIFGYFTWKVVETGRIAIPLLWRRIRR